MQQFKRIHYFKPQEFVCPCCGELAISQKLMQMLQEARIISNTPFIINSACRCEKHNKEVGGSPTSSHLINTSTNPIKECLAVDIKVTNSQQRHTILTALIKAGFTRIGIAKTFIHVDIDPTKPQNIIWGYW